MAASEEANALHAKNISTHLIKGVEMIDSRHPHRRTSKRLHREPFDIHVFLRELKIVVVDLGSIAVLAIWLWREAAHALIVK